MKFTCKVIASLFLLGSASLANASLIKDEFTFDDSTSIISDGNYEWLAWTETLGMSINQALSAYGADGWSIMHTNDLDYLYNAWYNINTFTNNVDVESFTTSVDNTLEVEFYEMFGCTVGPNYCDRTFSDDSVWSYTDQNGSNESGALILGESDKIIGAYVRDFSYYKATNISGEIQYGGYNRLARAYDFRTTSLDFNSTLAGVGLVRKIGAVDVPEPSSLAILILGIISLGWRRKING